MEKALRISPEVRKALEENTPVVALESTIITHGMPHPDNVETASACERAVRREGAVPATIAIIDGFLRVGLSPEEIETFAHRDDVMKAGKRDIAGAILYKRTASTTVSATILIAKMAGIAVFATGGIGGVHRDWEATFDVSRDLEELAVNDIAVVCAGPKAILDLPATSEHLETKGIEVVGYQTDELPAFYSRGSGLPVSLRLDSPEEVAALLKVKWRHGLRGGVLVVNPVSEERAIPTETIETATEEALAEASAKKISGKALTPFLLSRIEEATAGESLTTNKALVEQNAVLAARIAHSYSGEDT